MTQTPASIDAVQTMLGAQDYVCDRALGTVTFLALTLGKPLFLEGEPGTGKTEIAKAIARGLGRRLIRLQCYEGLDAGSAVYEWNFPAQMVAIRTAEAEGVTVLVAEDALDVHAAASARAGAVSPGPGLTHADAPAIRDGRLAVGQDAA